VLDELTRQGGGEEDRRLDIPDVGGCQGDNEVIAGVKDLIVGNGGGPRLRQQDDQFVGVADGGGEVAGELPHRARLHPFFQSSDRLVKEDVRAAATKGIPHVDRRLNAPGGHAEIHRAGVQGTGGRRYAHGGSQG